jgi:predicted alpha/beta-hydrolase family hydrolase
MELSPRLITVQEPKRPHGAVLVLHGGGSRRQSVAVSPTQLSVIRMIPVARRIARDPGLAVYRLLNSRRGWDAGNTPVRDARWALAQIRGRLGRDVPVVLVGHSLGGRAAILAGDDEGVVGVVALAAYVVEGDGAVDLSGRRVLFVHGTRDRIASLRRAEEAARQLSSRTDVGFIRVTDGTHSMLRHRRAFDGAAAELASALLTGTASRGAVGRVLAGESAVEI